MAQWAEINQNNEVLRVVVTDNNDPNGDEGYQWLIENLGGTWVQTSYNRSIRKNYAGIGFTYDPNLDAFIPPKPFNSWLLVEQTCQWQAPVPRPEGNYLWDEDSVSWLKVQEV
jgi:hypothetical protein